LPAAFAEAERNCIRERIGQAKADLKALGVPRRRMRVRPSAGTDGDLVRPTRIRAGGEAQSRSVSISPLCGSISVDTA
jgi:hypothetical protein